MRPDMSWICTKLALPMIRLAIIRPASFTVTGSASKRSASHSAYCDCKSAASDSRRKSLGKALPALRSADSFSRRWAMSLFSSIGCCSSVI